MANLFPIPSADKVLSSRFRIHPVEGDHMEPGLSKHRDYVLLMPVQTYCCEGIYLFDLVPGGRGTLLRVQNILGGKVLLKSDNPAYSTERIMTRSEFEEVVLAYVVADIKVRDVMALQQLCQDM